MRVILFSKDPTVWNKFISLKISSLFITFLQIHQIRAIPTKATNENAQLHFLFSSVLWTLLPFAYEDTRECWTKGHYFDLTLILELNHVGAVLSLDVQILSRQMITQQGKGSIGIYPPWQQIQFSLKNRCLGIFLCPGFFREKDRQQCSSLS